MSEPTCAWDEQCDRPLKCLGLCKRHHQYASRKGMLDRFRPGAAQCVCCGGPLPARRRSNKEYCSKRCFNSAYYARDPDGRQAAHKSWRDANVARHAAERLAKKVQRFCEECSTPLPITVDRRRRFCSRQCINALSLRRTRLQRYENHNRYRLRRLLSGGPGVTRRDWRRLVARFGHRCAYCGLKRRLTVDHVIPLIRGGEHRIGNVLPACRSCNSSKKDKLLAEWRRWRAKAGLPAAL